MLKTAAMCLFSLLSLSVFGCHRNVVVLDSNLEFAFHQDCRVRFGTISEAQHLLMVRDNWVKTLSPFDRMVRLQTSREVTDSQFLAYCSAQALEWESKEIEDLRQIFQSINGKLTTLGLRLDLPKRTLLIKTTGMEEGEALYTRQNAIIIPERSSGRSPGSLQGAMIHELFHIMTRYNPPVREILYSIIGFHPCGEVQLPQSLGRRKITNPDAYYNDYYIDIVVGEEQRSVIPVTYSKAEKYTEGALFDYVVFQLMEVEGKGEGFQPRIISGQPVLYDVSEVSNLFEQVGRNTPYSLDIIHPEEIMADNFRDLVLQRQDAPDPWIITGIRDRL